MDEEEREKENKREKYCRREKRGRKDMVRDLLYIYGRFRKNIDWEDRLNL